MCSPTSDVGPDEIRLPLPCSRYPQCRRECTWPACTEKEEPVDQNTYPPIGWINDEGLWVVTAAQADALPEGSLVAPLGDERGRTRSHAATEPHDERPLQGRVRRDGRWVGPTNGLAADETYRVLHPASPTQVAGEVAMSRSQFETVLARSRRLDKFAPQRVAELARIRHGIG